MLSEFGTQIGDPDTGLHLTLRLVTRPSRREKTRCGSKVLAVMPDGVLNLCRVKLRYQQCGTTR